MGEINLLQYLDNHTTPPSWICDHSKLSVESGCNGLQLVGLGHDKQYHPGSCFQQIPKSGRRKIDKPLSIGILTIFPLVVELNLRILKSTFIELNHYII